MTQAPAPSTRLITPFNVVAAMILAVGIPLAAIRFFQGLAAVGATSHTQPWGILIGFNVMCGVALSAGGFVTGTAVHIFGMKEYQPVVRPAILTGFLGYFFVVVALVFDLGQPWRLPYPMVVSFGVTSVLFLVAWHVALYLSTQFVEFSPAVFEWLGWKTWRKVAVSITVGATIFGVVLSTLHQSALGALFLIIPTKIHPLWYSPFIPLFFFVSAIAGGICMVIIEGTLSRRVYSHQVDIKPEQFDRITLGLGKAAGITMVVYFAIKVVGIAHSHTWHFVATPWGHWFLVELVGFVMLPGLLFAVGYRESRPGMIRWAAVITVAGVVLNRLNTSIIAFNWKLPSEDRFQLHWMELWVSLTIVTTAILVYRWIVNRMPVLYEHPAYKGMSH